MTQDDLAQMSREELIDLVLAQFGQITKLQADFEALKLKLEKGKKPPTNSGNSSQPPSRDQKADLSKKRKKHRHGPPVGHVKYERKFVAEPDHIVEVKPQVCEYCQTELRETGGLLADVNQITELPEAKAEVIEVRKYAVKCPCYEKTNDRTTCWTGDGAGLWSTAGSDGGVFPSGTAHELCPYGSGSA